MVCVDIWTVAAYLMSRCFMHTCGIPGAASRDLDFAHMGASLTFLMQNLFSDNKIELANSLQVITDEGYAVSTFS